MAAGNNLVVPRDMLMPGQWYVGDGWAGTIAVWDGEFFLGYSWIRGKCEPVRMSYCATVEGFTPHRIAKT